MATENILYYGDNLDIMRRHIKDETIDLVYLDPPFNSNTNYNVLFAEKNGSKAVSQIRAFEDTWTWNQESESIYADLATAGGRISVCLQAFRTFLGECDMLAYLVMMAPRLLELRRVLKSTGSIYLHCDPTASHYLKMLMDAIFGADNFRNEIVWHYTGRRMKAPMTFNAKHDTIFFYGKSKSSKILNYPTDPWTREEYLLLKKQELHVDENNREWIWGHAGKGKSHHYKIHIDDVIKEGKAVDDVWDIPIINTSAKERLGYPTQKPETLLERIINASSNPGDIVLDPFCGCGTTIAVAQKLDRFWIGIDITHLAINLIKRRLGDSFGIEPITHSVSPKKSESLRAAESLGEYRELIKRPFHVVGEPTSLPDAQVLADQDKYQFQWWALGLVGARPADQKKGADKGIDGKISFQGDKVGIIESVIISVKAGETLAPAFVRDLKGVLDREKAVIGVLITMQEPTSSMKTEAATAGFYESAFWGQKYPRVQLLTIAEILAGKKIDMPPIRQVDATFKKAPEVKNKQAEQQELKMKKKGKE